MSDKVILDHKNSNLVFVLKMFIFCDFFTNGNLLVKIAKNHKKLKFSKYAKYYILWSKMTSSDIISTKNSKSPGLDVGPETR